MERPDDARPLAGVASVLGRLAGRYGKVAVISGRPVTFLAEYLGGAVGATELVGLYGLERTAPHSAKVVIDPAASRWAETVAAVAAAAEAAAPPAVGVERKGVSVTVHFRQAPQFGRWAAEFAAQQQAQTGLVAHPGKQSWELRPPVSTDKGTVVVALAAGLGAVCFAGDDTGDLPAFSALGRLRAQGVETLGVAVGGPETPSEVLDAADLVVDGPDGVLDLLEVLAAGFPDGSASGSFQDA